ncbi:MAG TPA: cupin domain-containing protein [Candidatus Binatia bacterium]|nr:cupin domain-containing protein [Candidatus Binatia bacterium]
MAHATQRSEAHAKVVDDFLAGLSQFNIGPLWKFLGQALTPEPKSQARPYLWRWQELRPQLLRSGELVSAAEAERRVLMLLNPGLEGRIATTHTLYGGLQLILPGEVARTHRHTPNALRFIMEGEGAYTVVDGEKITMSPGDFVLTPNWTWHDHGSESTEPVVWLDGLDIPLIQMLEGIFFEPCSEESQLLTKPINGSVADYGKSGLLPTWQRSTSAHSPLLKYAWKDAREALMSLGLDATSPFDGAILEYVNPVTGGPSLPTMASFLQRLKPGQQTEAHRHSHSAVYLAVEGHGRTIIADKPYEWLPGDVFALPTWAWHKHENLSASEDAILFSFTDAPVMNFLHLYREQAM